MKDPIGISIPSGEYSKEEWRDLTRPIWPDDWTDQDFNSAWEEFTAEKSKRKLS